MTEDEKIVTIKSELNLDGPFSVTRKDVGTYSVMVGGLSGSFTVGNQTDRGKKDHEQ